MQITISFVENIGEIYNQKPCNDGYKWFVENFPDGAEHEEIFKRAIEDKKIRNATWALAYSMPKKQNVEWAIWCAEQVLPIFEEKYPNDDRPRRAIEAAKNYLSNPCDKSIENVQAAEAAEAAWAAECTEAAWAAECAEAAEWAAETVAWTADVADAAAWTAARANPDLSMQILKKGFEIWGRK